MSITRRDRRVITFYSYKGGVGRTMALANVAFRLADMHALDVVVVDWDLEAPGLHEFFGISPEMLAKTRGVLDYFIEWREAAKRKDPKPPDAREWLIPIEHAPRAPRHGSLRVLTAARLDDTYDARLSEFDWKDFYANSSGALAVETLRKQLIEDADVVLIDSRTGLTDAGGICTIQVPDGVVLMTTPNRQSLQGIERIARSIAKAGARDRAGRQRATTWLTVCRMPSAEDTPLAEDWIKLHSPQFNQMIEDGVLAREEHPHGLATYSIPQRARWGFDEVLFTEQVGASPSDSLVAAYKYVAATLLDWVVGPFDLMAADGVSPQEEEPSVEVLEKRAAAAEARRDIHGQLAALVRLGEVQSTARKHEEAVRVLVRAGDIALGAELSEYRAAIKFRLARALTELERTDEALEAAHAALALASELNNTLIQARALMQIGYLKVERDGAQAAAPYFTRAIVAARASGDTDHARAVLRFMGKFGKIEGWQAHIDALLASGIATGVPPDAALTNRASARRKRGGRTSRARG